MKNKYGELILKVIMLLMLAYGTIGVLMYWLPEVSEVMARLIYSNPVTKSLHYKFSSSLTILITLVNAVYAFARLIGTDEKDPSTRKSIIAYVIYFIISLGITVVSFLTAFKIFKDAFRSFR